MDLIEADDEGKIILDGAALVKIILLTLFGIAGALTIIKCVNCIVYKCYVKFCKKEGKISDKNQNTRQSREYLARRSLHQTPLVLRAGLRHSHSTFIQIQPEDLSTEQSELFDNKRSHTT